MLTIHADQVPAQAWRNGGGHTRELLARPAGADWRLRLSLADIDADGPFSEFPGVERWFAVVRGAGVRLRFADGERALHVGDAPLRFDGAAAPGCALIAGPTRDLNLMLRAGTGAMRTVEAGQWWDESFDERGLFTLGAGRWQAEPPGGHGTSVECRVEALTLLWDLGPAACRFVPDGTGPWGWWLGFSEHGA